MGRSRRVLLPCVRSACAAGAIACYSLPLVGYVLSTDIPLGTFFWLAHQPSRLVAVPTPEVPLELRMGHRPAAEMFVALPDGARMPASGLGMCCRATAYDDSSVRRSVLWYLLQGGRHIDTAALYLNRRPIGEGIGEAIRRGIPRSELFINTKIDQSYFGERRAMAWVPQMLAELQLDYVDLVLLHAPRRWMIDRLGLLSGKHEFAGCCGCESPRACREQTWRVLSAARQRGLIRNVGVSNHRIHQLEELRALRSAPGEPTLAPIAVHQLQYHPWVPPWQENIARYCRRHEIQLTAYFSLGGTSHLGSTTTVDALRTIASAHHRTVHAVLLRW